MYGFLLDKKSSIYGTIINIDSDNRIIYINNNNQDIKLILDNETKMVDIKNQPIIFSEFNLGFEILANLEKNKENTRVEKIQIKKSPNIIIISPKNNEKVKDIFKINGSARVFENVLQIEIKNKKNQEILYKQPITAHPLDIGLYGPFEVDVDLSKFNDLENIEINAFQYSAKDGSIIDKTIINLSITK